MIVVGDAARVDFEAETSPAVTVTVSFCVIARLLMVAETAFSSALVELSVPVATPLALVVEVGWVSVLPVPVAARTTGSPPIGLPLASLAVTVIVEGPSPAWIVSGAACTVDRDTER